MTKCTVCGKDELLPFTCSYCGQAFCAEHRLPENHDCPALRRGAIGRVINLRRVQEADSRVVYERPSYFGTSRTELKHLAAAILVFFLVEALRFYPYWFNTTFLAMMAASVILAFALHELAHKFAAQYYGLWAEFRIDPFGIVISLITAIPVVPFKIIAPGAVVVFGYTVTRERMGKIAVAGPLTNIVQALVFKLVPLHPFLRLAAVLNADLALFNLLPLSVLDGRKVFDWSRLGWVSAFGVSLVLWLMMWAL